MNEFEHVDLHANEMKIHGRSKKELFNLLTIQGHYYLPPISQCNADFIAQIMTGEKKVRN